jgi:hypothetical protein
MTLENTSIYLKIHTSNILKNKVNLHFTTHTRARARTHTHTHIYVCVRVCVYIYIYIRFLRHMNSVFI